MNKDDVAGLVERLRDPCSLIDKSREELEQADADMVEAADALTTLSAENERLVKANRLRMEETHKERAEAKLWFEKAQEWKSECSTLSARVVTLEAALRFIAASYNGYAAQTIAKNALAGDDHG